MQKFLIIVFLGLTSVLIASEKSSEMLSPESSTNITVVSPSYVSRIAACVQTRLFGCVALAGAGIYGLYRWAIHLMYQEEERMFDDHQELEKMAISKKDFDMVHALIDAMDDDVTCFDAQPSRVNNLELSDFDDEEMANGCDGVRSAFCALYEQTVRHPDNKPFLEEFVMIFRHAIDDTMVVV